MPRSVSTIDETDSTWFVLGVWLCLTIIAFGFVAFYGNHTPRWEDWFLVPAITGIQPVNLRWLWEDVQGHRIPILKLLLLGCYSLFGFDSKPILYLNVACFSALSLILLWAIYQVRGRTAYADAYLPIVLLNLGQTEAFLWAQTFLYVAATCLQTILLVLIVTNREILSRMSLVLAGICLCLLPLVFGGGLVFATVMVPWLIYQGWVVPRSKDTIHVRIITVVFASTAMLIIGFYFIHYRPYKAVPLERHLNAGLFVYAATALKYLAAGLGGAASIPWWKLPAVLVALINLIAILCLILGLSRCRWSVDSVACGLSSYILAFLTVAVIIGITRYQWNDTVLDSRYSAMSATGLIASYFIWELYGMRSLLRLGRMLLVMIVTYFLHANLQLGVQQAVARRDAERAFLQDLDRKLPVSQLVAHHAWITYYYHDQLARYLSQLRGAGISPYDQLPSNPTLSTRTLDLHALIANELAWDGSTGKTSGANSYLQLNLQKPQFVSALRFRFSLLDPPNTVPALRIQWYSQTKAQFQQYNAPYISTGPKENEVVVYIDDTIASVLILPNNQRSIFQMSNLQLLFPPSLY